LSEFVLLFIHKSAKHGKLLMQFFKLEAKLPYVATPVNVKKGKFFPVHT
jgi:hypothetical protein